jgi:hypothetical protein
MARIFTPEGIDLGLRFDVGNSLEQQNLFEYAARRRKKGVPPPRHSVMSILLKFIEEKVEAEVRTQPRLEALCEYNDVLEFLVHVGQSEFRPQLATVKSILDLYGTGLRDHLVRKYLDLDTPPDKVAELHEILVNLIPDGYWPNFATEWPAAVEAAELRNRGA